MKKLFKTPVKTGTTPTRLIRLLLLLLMAWGSVATYAQTIGIIQGLTPVTLKQGPPFNGGPTVEFPVIIPGPSEIYANRFYKFDTSGNLVDIYAYPATSSGSQVCYGSACYTGYCVNCTVSDFPQIYRAVTLNCNPGSVIPWKPVPYSDPTLSVSTNNCTTSEVWSNPLTWTDYKVPTQATGGFYLSRNVTLDVNYDATNKGIQSLNGSSLIINSGVTFTSVNTNAGRFINNGVMNGIGQHANLVNNGVLSPGVNGIGQFLVRYGNYTQNSSGSLNIQLASTNSFDQLYCFQNNADNIIGGTLKVSLLNGFVPVANNSFKVFESAGIPYTGTFSNLVLPTLSTGLKWKIHYNPSDVTLTVVNCAALSTSFTTTNSACYGSATGSLTVTPINGLAPFQYKLNSGAFGSANTFTGLRAGNYKVYVTDANGCTSITPTIAISQFPAIAGTATVTNATCYGISTGSITVTPTTGTAPFTYRLGTTGSYVSSNTFGNLKAGAYYVYIKDANSCTGYVKVTVSQPPAITGTFTKTDVIGCYGGANGSLSVTPTTGFAPYQYKLNATGTYGPSNSFSGLKASTYRVYIKDANGCEGYVSVPITQPIRVSATISITPVSCPGATDGAINAVGTSGIAPYIYRLGTSGAYGPSGSFTNLSGKNYALYVLDANNCGYAKTVTVLAAATTCFDKMSVAKAGITTPNSNAELRVSLSPNPSSNVFKLTTQTAKAEAIQLRVIDINGKVVYTAKGLPTQTFTFGEALTNGVYLIEVRQGNEVKTTKVIKN